MDIFADLLGRVAAILLRLAVRGVLPAGIDAAASSVVPSPAGSPSDAVVDAALVHARAAAAYGLDPRAFARLLAAEIAMESPVLDVEATDRGFIDVTFRPGHLAAALAALSGGGPPVPPPPRAWPEDCSLDVARAAAVDGTLAALDAARGRPPAGPTRVGPVSVARWSGDAVPPGRAFGSREAREACGAGALRFAFAAAEPATPLALDLDALADRWRGNPAFWVPYVHARCRAVLRRAAPGRSGDGPSPTAFAGDAPAHPDGAPSGCVGARANRRVLRAVLRTPWVMSGCAASRSARRVAIHLVEVADAVQPLQSASTYQPQSRFVNEERRDCVGVRLGLVSASALVLKSGLGILGLTAADEVP